MKGGKVAMASKTTIMGRPFMKTPPSIIMNALDSISERRKMNKRNPRFSLSFLETSKL